ncbi:aldose epimerase family protein [Niallia oryzisoli]|uniref:aldose epimerase family protein n=1 Tax=Niallia oryzisoli TaxID=1737571 RepID=UPI003736CF33
MRVSESIFGYLDNRPVKSYTVETAGGMKFTCIEYGCIITEINIPDRNGIRENVVLGFDSLEEYMKYSPYFGCTIGRNAGRIKNASFQLDDVVYKLSQNDGPNNLHSGQNGFHHVIWESSIEINDQEVKIKFQYMSQDGEEGFPGNLHTVVTYTFNNANEFVIEYNATTDKKTIVNLTNHSYFNLSGNYKRSILDHELVLKSNQFLELDSDLNPTGQVVSVQGTAFDFRFGQNIAQGIETGHPQTKLVGSGYDHPFLLNQNHDKEIVVMDKESGRKLEVETDEPSVVVYTGNMLPNDFQIRGKQSEKYLGLCLETQKPPNMMNNPQYSSSYILEPNHIYHSRTKYSFKLME